MRKIYLTIKGQDGNTLRTEQFSDLSAAYSYAQGYWDARADVGFNSLMAAFMGDVFSWVEKGKEVRAFWDKKSQAAVIITPNKPDDL